MDRDFVRNSEETTIWSEVPDLRDKVVRLLRIQGLLDRATLDQVLAKSANGGGSMSQILIESGLLEEEKVVAALEAASGYPALDPRTSTAQSELIALFPLDEALRLRALPLLIKDQRLFVVMENPVDADAKRELEQRFGMPVEPYIHHTQALFDAIGMTYPQADTETLTRVSRQEGRMRSDPPEEVEITETEVETGLLFTPVREVFTAPISEVFSRPLFTQRRTVTRTVSMPRGLEADLAQAYTASNESATAVVEALLTQAIEAGATDIHIEPMQDAIRVRLRRDQILSTINYLALELHSAVVNRIKVLAAMDLAERRKIQEGAFRFQTRRGRRTNFRASIMPSSRGETVELRVVDGRQGRWDLAQLGMSEADLRRFERNLYYPNGLILVTGPTASGKTTTLYSALKRLNVEGRKIITAEDPIEYDLYGVTQVEVNPKTGLTYERALKGFLRQDPDVMMLGEIRDREVAEVAISAAMTGHLVLAALHTNDASSAPARLIQTLGCDPMLVCDALLMVIAQRLVRNVCQQGRQQRPIDGDMRRVFGELIKDLEHESYAEGCDTCHNTGFSGVSAVFEVMDVSPRIKELIFEGARPSALFQAAYQEGMRPMILNAIDDVRAGITNLDEVKRVLMYKRLF
jgi:type IV pilus assembly protein PilB